MAAVELHMLPVDAGDATLIIDRSQGRPYTVLIDAGLDKYAAVAYLQSVGVSHLDLIILSHPDLDHLQGLLAVVDNPLISIGQVWCFDLAFLREFVETGRIPRPKDPTRRIIYASLLRTLDGTDRFLTRLAERQVLTLQVSAGHRLTLGSLYIEVLYPWDGFYDALRSPVCIRELLAKKWPAGWVPPEWARADVENQRPTPARKATVAGERAELGRLLDEFNSSDPDTAPGPLATPEEADRHEAKEDELSNDPECLPISTVGTLYNNLSIVAKIHVLGGINPATLLFPGDLTDWTYLIASRLPDLSSDVFKYPHHGSAASGVSRSGLRQLWHSSCCRRCCEPWHRRQCACTLAKTLAARNACELFIDVVKPRHVLVYPYPSRGLPKCGALSPFTGPIHANRKDVNADHLAFPANPAVPHVLSIGKERDEIV